MLRIYLEAHRIHGTLHEPLELPCQCYDGGGVFTKPLLEHVIMSQKVGVTPEARVATARLLVKEFGADPLACYPDSLDVASHLRTAASLAQVELMEFLILGRSSVLSFSPLSLALLPSLSIDLLLSRAVTEDEVSIQIELTPTHPLAASPLRPFAPFITFHSHHPLFLLHVFELHLPYLSADLTLPTDFLYFFSFYPSSFQHLCPLTECGAPLGEPTSIRRLTPLHYLMLAGRFPFVARAAVLRGVRFLIPKKVQI